MNYMRTMVVVAACTLGALAMGHVGCSGGGAIPFGDGSKISDLLSSEPPAAPTSPGKPISSEPVATPTELPPPVVTLVNESVPPPEEGGPTVPVPCLMNYADNLKPQMLLALKNTPNILALQQFLDTLTKDRLMMGMDDLVGMVPSLATEMIVGKGKDLFVLLRFDPATADEASAMELTKLVADKLNEDLAARVAEQPPDAMSTTNRASVLPSPFGYARIVNDPDLAFVVSRDPLLTEAQNLKVKTDCLVCTVGSCNEKKPSDAMIIVRGSLLKQFTDTLITPDDKCAVAEAPTAVRAPSDAVASYDSSFALSRLVIGIDAVEGKTMSFYAALFSGEDCSQTSLAVSASVYFNLANPFGKALLSRIICNTVGTATRMPATPADTTTSKERVPFGDATVQPAVPETDAAPARDFKPENADTMKTSETLTGAASDAATRTLQAAPAETLTPATQSDAVKTDAATAITGMRTDATITPAATVKSETLAPATSTATAVTSDAVMVKPADTAKSTTGTPTGTMKTDTTPATKSEILTPAASTATAVKSGAGAVKTDDAAAATTVTSTTYTVKPNTAVSTTSTTTGMVKTDTVKTDAGTATTDAATGTGTRELPAADTEKSLSTQTSQTVVTQTADTGATAPSVRTIAPQMTAPKQMEPDYYPEKAMMNDPAQF